MVNRKKLITSLANELVEPFDKLSKKTRVPKSRLIDEAVEDLLKKGWPSRPSFLFIL